MPILSWANESLQGFCRQIESQLVASYWSKGIDGDTKYLVHPSKRAWGKSWGAALQARGETPSFLTLLLGFTFYFKYVFSTFENSNSVQSKNFFLSRFIKANSDANKQILRQLSFPQFFVKNLFVICWFGLRTPVYSHKTALKDCNVSWRLTSVVSKLGLWADFMWKTFNGDIF